MNKKIYYSFLIVSIVWTAFIFLIPVFDNFGGFFAKIADFGYIFYSTTCHQIDERSFFIFGHKVAVCSRCSSSYVAFLISVIVYPFIRGIDNKKMPSLFLLFTALFLLAADVFLDISGIISNTFLSRMITGGFIGFVLPFYLIPGSVNFFGEIYVKIHEHK